MQLTGKIILITGGSGFLGEHFTNALKADGATVISTDREHADIALDVTSKASISSVFNQIIETYGKIDVVINNAAIDPKFDAQADKNAALFENYPEEHIKKSLEVNLLGYTLVAQEAIKRMLIQKSGNIINVSSIYGVVGPDQNIYPEGTQKPVDYFITKGGVVMLTKFLATTYGCKGIRSNTLTLGGVFKEHGKDFTDKYGARTPLGRMANPEEVGGPMVFLASDASSYMTGANLIVDGGWTAW
ncbi:MAG TPA: SDR family oxidoreductase [Candidatus Andersenbacteria bacterium]|nr:SDR family oxidoreductase [Candidatus Andersenbacteria bacterium]